MLQGLRFRSLPKAALSPANAALPGLHYKLYHLYNYCTDSKDGN